jgi:hypothetical protein
VDAEVNVPPTSGTKAGVAGCVQVKPFEEFPTIFGRIFNVGSITVASGAVACASAGLGGPYAVFAGSTTCQDTLSLSGDHRTVNGNVHSNNDVKISASGTTINGVATYLHGDAPVGNITYNPSTGNPMQLANSVPYPEVFEIDDYAPGGAKATLAQSQGKYHNAGSDEIDYLWLTLHLLINPLSNTIAPGLYYTTGDIVLNDNGFNSSGATFVSRAGDVRMNGNDFSFTPWDPDGLLIFSNKNQTSCSGGNGVVKVNGNDHAWTGIMFAPRGPIQFNGEGISASLNGRLVGQTIDLSGIHHTITRNPSYVGRTDGFELAE